jgi:hypothetical protein
MDMVDNAAITEPTINHHRLAHKMMLTKDHDTWLGNPGPGKIIKNVA